MRVAFLTHEPFYPPSGGGSAEAIYLVEELRRRGHEVHIFCPEIEDAKAVGEKFGVQFHLFTKWQMGRYTSLRSLKYLAYPSQLRRMVEAAGQLMKFDLVLSQHAISAAAAGPLRKSLGVPVVMNFLDYLTAFMETWPVWLAPPVLLKQLKKFELGMPNRYGASGVLTVSDTLAELVAETGFPKERIQPMYYGYDAALFPLRTEAPEQPPIVVMHGSFDQHHLGPIALEAIGVVTQARPDVRFRFLGKHTDAVERIFQQVVKRYPNARVECTGFIPYAEIGAELRAGSVGIIPYEESTGVHSAFIAKAVEYLGVGLPVVSTRARGIQRYFSDEPLMKFSDFDGKQFGAEILNWLATPQTEIQQLAVKASARVRQELDWRVLCARAVDFCERMAKQS